MRLNGFDLNQLVCLEALLSERSVSRAAARIHLSQSAVSWVLARLREHFDDPLLVRSGRHLVLTPFAAELVGPVTEILTRAHAFTALTPGRDAVDIDRELKIVASDYMMTACLAEAIRRALDVMPNLRFDVLPLTSGAGQSLAAGDIDLLLAGQAFEVEQPPNEALFDDVFVCLGCAEQGPDESAFGEEDYLTRRHVVVRYFENRMSFEDEELLWRKGLRRSHQIAVWSYALVPQLVCGTAMIATVRARIADRIAQHWPVKVLPFPYAQEPVHVFGYWHASRDEDPVLKRFLECVREAAAAP